VTSEFGCLAKKQNAHNLVARINRKAKKRMNNKDTEITALHKAFCEIKSEDEIKRFLIDLCTPKEIEAFAERWAIARALHQGGKGYREIAAEIGSSTTTVARVARFLNQENYGGYKLVLSRISEKENKVR